MRRLGFYKHVKCRAENTRSACLFSGQRGFTLIEIIATLLLAGIVGTSVAAYMGLVPQSVRPVQMASTLLQLNQAMDRVTSCYRNRISPSFSLSALQSDITAMNLASTSGITPASRYVTFNSSGTEQDAGGTSRYLEVKLTKNGQSVTALFSQ